MRSSTLSNSPSTSSALRRGAIAGGFGATLSSVASARPGCRTACRRLWRARIAHGIRCAFAWLAVVGLPLFVGCADEARDLIIPTTYVLAGRVIDPTTDPITGLAGASVSVDTAPAVSSVATDSDGYFVLQGVPAGVHRLRARLAGRVVTLSYDLPVQRNVIDALVPVFSDAQIDSILVARGAPAWNRAFGLFGLFALKSNGVPLGDALVNFTPSPGGTTVQTGEGKDPIVVVNGAPGTYSLSIARGGYVWDAPYGVALRSGVLTFAAPRARPNFGGYVFGNQPSGAAVEGAAVTIVSGPETGASTTTSFLGQFSLVGLAPGTHTARIVAAGFLPELTWPQRMDQDTTLVQVLVEPDTLAAWSLSDGGPGLDPTRGSLAVDARAAVGGEVALGATIAIGEGQGGGVDTSIPQEAGHPALRINLDPGWYRVWVTVPGFADSPVIDSVEVRASEITYTRIELSPPVVEILSADRRP